MFGAQTIRERGGDTNRHTKCVVAAISSQTGCPLVIVIPSETNDNTNTWYTNTWRKKGRYKKVEKCCVLPLSTRW
jgi:hypothetical protein